MSNIKLKDHNWATDGIYDTNQSKTQKTINSDVSTKIGQATLQTTSQNLSGATNELKGRADTLDSKYANVVTVTNTQPSSEYNKIWLPITVSEGTQVPTYDEHLALQGALTNVGSFTTTSITTQVDALNAGEYVGTVNGSTSGLPIATSGVIQAVIYNTNYKRIFYYPNGGADVVYVLAKSGGTWQSTWTLLPSRTDITTLQTALTPTAITNIVKEESTVTLNAYNVYKMGRSVFIYINITLSQQLATNTTILSGFPGAVATWVFLGGSPDNNILKMFMVNTSGYLRTSGTVPADHYLIVGTYISAS